MKINENNYSYHIQNHSAHSSFGSAKDITLEYILKNRERLLPERIRRKASIWVSKKNKIKNMPTLKELHESTYAPLLSCKTLGEAQNRFPEFKEVLQANVVISKGSKNTRKIEEHVPLKDLSLYVLKERWGKMRTLNDIALELGLKDRSALGWVLDKIRMPDLGKNYQMLLKASDEQGNRVISSKVKAYNSAHRDAVIAHNRAVSSMQSVRKLNGLIAQEAWKRLPHVQEALREFSKTTNSQDRFAAFWSKYPQFAKEFGAMKRTVALEMKAIEK